MSKTFKINQVVFYTGNWPSHGIQKVRILGLISLKKRVRYRIYARHLESCVAKTITDAKYLHTTADEARIHAADMGRRRISEAQDKVKRRENRLADVLTEEIQDHSTYRMVRPSGDKDKQTRALDHSGCWCCTCTHQDPEQEGCARVWGDWDTDATSKATQEWMTSWTSVAEARRHSHGDTKDHETGFGCPPDGVPECPGRVPMQVPKSNWQLQIDAAPPSIASAMRSSGPSTGKTPTTG